MSKACNPRSDSEEAAALAHGGFKGGFEGRGGEVGKPCLRLPGSFEDILVRIFGKKLCKSSRTIAICAQSGFQPRQKCVFPQAPELLVTLSESLVNPY